MFRPALVAGCLAIAHVAGAQQQRSDPPPGQRPPPDGARGQGGDFRGPRGDGNPRGDAPGRGQFAPGMAELNLDDEQRKAFRGMMESLRDHARDNGEKLMKARRELNEAIYADKVDSDAIQKKAVEMGKLEGESAVMRAEAFGKLRYKLSPEQIEKIRKNPFLLGGGMMGSPGQPGQPGQFGQYGQPRPGGGDFRRPGGDQPPGAPRPDGAERPRRPGADGIDGPVPQRRARPQGDAAPVQPPPPKP
jgi:Spy/CpxP family protein refolding chaperone